MTAIKPRLYVLDRVSIAEAILATLPPHEFQRFSHIDEIINISDDAVVVIAPDLARDVLARSRSKQVVIVGPLQPNLATNPVVVGMLDDRCGHETILTVLKSALALAAQARGMRAQRMLEQVLEIGRALASEKELTSLLPLILAHARDLTHADGASIYTRDMEGRLWFRYWQNASVGNAASTEDVLVADDSIAGYVSRTGELLVLDDAYLIPREAPYHFNSESDRKLHYRTRSLLTVPLKNKAGDVVGVLQLINRKSRGDVALKDGTDVDRYVLPFGSLDQAIAAALAGQAGVALENSALHAEIERMFKGFIKASVQAIEARDPTTAGHSFRVADFTQRLALAVNRDDSPSLRGVHLNDNELLELRYASLLHDFGKVGIREDVLVKAKKLYPHQLELIKQRFRFAGVSLERRAYQQMMALQDQGMGDAERLQRVQDIKEKLVTDRQRLEAYLSVVLSANEPTISHQAVAAELEHMLSFKFPSENGDELPLLEDFEFTNLALSKGSLNPVEREEIESHVSLTFDFLSLIPWTRGLQNVPLIAHSHHEKLDGSGYPRQLRGVDIPVQSRMMTIADIYDALTAGDRPYKRGLVPEQALDILDAEARGGKIDADLFRVFVNSKAWRLVF